LDGDDLIVAEESSAKFQERFGEWQSTLESKGLKVNVNKTETIICAKIEEPLHITDRNGNVLKQLENFRSGISTGGCEEDVEARISTTCKSGVNCQECCVTI